jgi:hypothetical protein
MKRVLIWGTGKTAKRCLNVLNDNVVVIAFVESNVENHLYFEGKKVISGNFISTVKYDFIILANIFENEILTQFDLDRNKVIFFRAIEDHTQVDKYNLFRNNFNVYVSFGENCLTDGILKRFNIKSFTTPYSHGRSNIEYINTIEKDNFAHFLNPNYLKYENLNGKQVVRSVYYTNQNNIYENSVMQGFEFTHHDVLNNPIHINTFNRRIDRLKALAGAHLYIFYHHRYCEKTNEKQLLSDLSKIHDIYTNRNNLVHVILFTQKLVDTPLNRKVIYHPPQSENSVHVFYFYTLNIWGSSNQDIFWARIDDDLIAKMINFIQKGNLENLKYFVPQEL